MERYERVSRETTTTDPATDELNDAPVSTNDRAFTLARGVWFLTGLLELLLAFRFVLALLGANPANGFADFIYTVSYPFVEPFFTLFRYNDLHLGVSRFEVFTLFAMAVYAAIGWALASLVSLAIRPRTTV